MEAQTISFPPAFLFPSIPYFGLYLPGRTCTISLVPLPHLPPFTLSVSSVLSIVVSFWLTSSLVSFLPFSVGSLEKLCALRGEHPFYMRAKYERTHTCERAASSSSFFPFPSVPRARTFARVYVFLRLRTNKMLLTKTNN